MVEALKAAVLSRPHERRLSTLSCVSRAGAEEWACGEQRGRRELTELRRRRREVGTYRGAVHSTARTGERASYGKY